MDVLHREQVQLFYLTNNLILFCLQNIFRQALQPLIGASSSYSGWWPGLGEPGCLGEDT
jgi:hypothetical protein